MLRRTTILTAAALALCCSLAPAAVASYGDVPPPPSSIAASQADEYQDLRPPDVKDAAAHRGLYATEPGASTHSGPGFTDAERKLVESPRVQAMVDRISSEIRATEPGATTHPGPGFTDAERKLVESAEVQAMIDRISSEIRATPAVVEVEAPSGGFDWGDAGIGAAGMLALFSIAGGSALLIAGRRRRGGVSAATH
jgi:hypothetical protein